MMNNEVLHPSECKCFSWQPIIAGALVAIGLSFLLNLFGVAIELTAFTTNNRGVETLVFGGLLATALGVVVSMFATGWLTGYLGQRHCSKGHLGALYGFLAWCLALVLVIFLADPVQHYLSFYGHFLSGTTDVMQVNSAVAANNVMPTMHDEVKSLVISKYIIFCLFFLSAFACSLGGHCGMRHVCKRQLP